MFAEIFANILKQLREEILETFTILRKYWGNFVATIKNLFQSLIKFYKILERSSTKFFF